ncbi:IS630 family transposase [Streptomyces sp. NPDC005761]|uniref:IS630 family transposase n=1 Tax=unclassified Streptomyces TaxID=2593676 RepID=UPI0033E317E7
MRVTAGDTKRVSMAALICTKSGHQPRLIYRTQLDRGPAEGRRKGFTEADYARLLDAAHQVEGVWSHLKRSLANRTQHSLDQFTALVKTRLKRMQYRPGVIDGLAAKTGLDFQPP